VSAAERVIVTLFEIVLDAPLSMEMLVLEGAVVSVTTKLMLSDAVSETFPVESLNHA
jgi:hypothetical protein